MLQHLSIRNFILIDELDLEFEEAFCVITGETGAGKSIILDSILFCLGGKFNLPSKTKMTSVCASFVNTAIEITEHLKILGIEHNDLLIIKRVESVNRVKKFFINDQLVTLKTIEYITPYLFEIHGQNTHTSLLSSGNHVDILDHFGNLKTLRTEILQSYKNLQDIKAQITQIESQKENINNEIEYLSFVVEELIKIDIKQGEEEELDNLRQNLRKEEKEIKLASEILSNIEDSEVALALSKILRLMGRKNAEPDSFKIISDHLEFSYDHVEQAISKLKQYLNSSKANNLDEVEERLFAIKEIARKYKVPAYELNKFLSESKVQLLSLQSKIASAYYLEVELVDATDKYQKLAINLSQSRACAADQLRNIVQNSLSQLNMAQAIFKIEISQNIKAPTSKGIDNIRFMASTNPGQPLLPIDRVASGGELARFMLALKTALFDKYKKPLMIFDEIDTGIGGSAANSVGEHLKKLSTSAQVLVITHQPQIAGKADQHILVQKMQSKDHTIISVKSLEQKDRVNEIARMIAGNNITDTTLKTAQELLTFSSIVNSVNYITSK